MDTSASKRFYRVYNTVRKMLQDRGYFVSAYKDMTFEEFEATYRTKESLNILVFKAEDSDEKINVFFSDTDKFGKTEADNIVRKLKEKGIHRAIVILKFDSKFDTSYYWPDTFIETFFEEELIVNITEHELVPKHEILSDDDKRELLKRYKLKESQLPKMLINDPITRYFGLKRGQVVKIVRESETAGKYITYRMVS